uniref:DDHD domain-containing protein n=2 Tax=Globodera pallida TaxID=36090 RepID=A0A183CHZ1_GLOPA
MALQQNGEMPSSPNVRQKIVPTKKNVITIGKVKRRVTELKCAEVRWFYKNKEDAKWTPFKGFDSTVLEIAYRRKVGMPLDEAAKTHVEKVAIPTSSVIVLDGNYRADEQMESVSAIYWGEDTLKIHRGSWFYADSFQPVRSDFADAIEAHHLKSFRDNVIPETPVFSDSESSKKPVLTTLKWNEKEVRWNSVVDLFIAGRKGRVLRWVTRAEGNVPLRRGFKDEADALEGMPNFSDLILVVHGIGQKGYQHLIAKNSAQIREAMLQLMDKNYPNEKRRPAVLPVEWRSALALDDGVTDVATLPKMEFARSTLNSTLMDLMYYQSPLYRTEIVNGVIRCLNSIYTTFKDNNPGFDGPVSIVGHSLGSVIAYDIMTRWSPFLLYDKIVSSAIEENMQNCEEVGQRKLLEDLHNSRKRILEVQGFMEQILISQEERIKFKVKNLFCLGSPLAIFIIMRGANYKSVIPQPDQLERIFNIFHPYDPVAYRLEPVFHENYRHVRPMKLLSSTNARQCYESAVYECHASYLKSQSKSKKKKKGGGKSGEDKLVEDNESKSGGKTHTQSEGEDDEQRHFRHGADSDSDDDAPSNGSRHQQTTRRTSPTSVAPNTPTTAHGPGDCSATLAAPEEVDSACEAGEDGVGGGGQQDERTAATPTDDVLRRTFTALEQNGGGGAVGGGGGDGGGRVQAGAAVPATAELGKDECGGEGRSPTGVAVAETAAAAGTTAGAAAAAASLDDPKFGDAAHLVEDIPAERRLPLRLDFQIQPGAVPNGYWAMLRSHFSYWTNMDLAAFILNAIYPPPPPSSST